MKKVFKLICLICLMFSGITLVKASSASISVSSSSSKIVVGKTFNVTIKVSSSTTLGSWEFTPSYDSSKLKLTSGETSVADVGDGKIKSKTYSYKFKAISTGTAKISVKSYGAVDWNESKMSVNVSSKSVSIVTQADIEASYSKNNNLKSLSIEGLKLSPSFSKDTTKYTVEASSNTTSINIKASVEDSKSSIKGTGKHEVSEGENKFNITVTAQNGSSKTYTIIVNVIDSNPITVKIDNEEYTVVKRESNLETPEGFEKTTIKINDQNIPAFYNKTNNYTLVGLSKDGDIELYLYDEKNNKYSKYIEVILNEMKIAPLPIDKTFDDSYKKTSIKIGETIFDALKMDASDFYIIHTKDLVTGKDDYYTYDSVSNTMIRYNDDNTKPLKQKILEYKKMILFLGIETVLIIIILVCILINKARNNKKEKEILKQKELEKKKESKKKKEVKKDEKKKQDN